MNVCIARNEKDAKTLGPQMIFVTMKNGHSEPLPDVASRWKEVSALHSNKNLYTHMDIL